MQQVFTKDSSGYKQFEVRITCGNDPNIRPLDRCTANGKIFTLFQKSERRHLRADIHTIDFVKEEHSSLRLRDDSTAGFLGVRNSAARVPEQFAFH